jgi:hypothetical protein
MGLVNIPTPHEGFIGWAIIASPDMDDLVPFEYKDAVLKNAMGSITECNDRAADDFRSLGIFATHDSASPLLSVDVVG